MSERRSKVTLRVIEGRKPSAPSDEALPTARGLRRVAHNLEMLGVELAALRRRLVEFETLINQQA
ncbi:MAG: hypothetical protein AMXMBFR7_41020 [Planctomycetota bacterium]